MRAGQIIKGKIDGVQKHFQTVDLPEISEERLSILTDQTDIGLFKRFFKEERVFAQMLVKEADNSDGRRGGLVKQIVMYQYDRAIIHDGEPYLFNTEGFIAKLPRCFKMPPFPETLENPLPPIPPLEWEVL